MDNFIDDPFGEENHEKDDRKRYFIKRHKFPAIESTIIYNISMKDAIEKCKRWNAAGDAFTSYSYHLMEGTVQNEYSM